jgi:hypothetical protein
MKVYSYHWKGDYQQSTEKEPESSNRKERKEAQRSEKISSKSWNRCRNLLKSVAICEIWLSWISGG